MQEDTHPGVFGVNVAEATDKALNFSAGHKLAQAYEIIAVQRRARSRDREAVRITINVTSKDSNKVNGRQENSV
jgi:hypothetical protein